MYVNDLGVCFVKWIFFCNFASDNERVTIFFCVENGNSLFNGVRIKFSVLVLIREFHSFCI